MEKGWPERKELLLERWVFIRFFDILLKILILNVFFMFLINIFRFLDSDSYNAQYKKLLGLLEENLNSKKHSEEILWITYRILDEESRRKILE